MPASLSTRAQADRRASARRKRLPFWPLAEVGSEPLRDDPLARTLEGSATRPARSPSGHHLRTLVLLSALALAAGAVLAPLAVAQAPSYESFGRDQILGHDPAPENLLRIWMVYVNQGDGLLIQLPPKCGYDPDPDDDSPARSETVDILIDGGSNPSGDAERIEDFVESLYGAADEIRIEYAVLTHHDQDHVAGLTRLLENPRISIEAIYHNGLASYRGGKKGFPDDSRPDNAVVDFSGGTLKRGMAFLEDDGVSMKPEYLVRTKQDLNSSHEKGELHGVYEDFASAVLSKRDPARVAECRSVKEKDGFIKAREENLPRKPDLRGLEFDVLWPPDPPRRFAGWSETINGNSVTFRLTYGKFQMLFTGDHNDLSEKALVEHLKENGGDTSALECDVLKVPHHGAGGKHADETFFRKERLKPVLSVASMGEMGFRSKKVSGTNAWQHPSDELIQWLGGAHRFYSTHIHERRFGWASLTSASKVNAMIERKHILVETDGEWFRVVEVAIDEHGGLDVPSVSETKRGDGTRWIRAE